MLRNQGVGRRRRPRGENGSDSEEDDEEESEDDEDDEDAVADEHRGTGGGHDGKADEDAVNLAGAMHSLHPFESSGVLGEASAQAESPTTESTFKFVQRADSRRELTDSLLQRADEPSQTEINIAVIGGDEVDRAGFIARALGLPQLPATHAASRSLPFRRSMYLVRLLEVAIGDDDDAYVVSPGEEEDEQAPSPDESRAMPRIDGALALYDVRHRDGHSVSRLLTMLGALPPKDGEAEIPAAAAAIAGVGIPKMLVSCRCETPAAERLIDPARVEANLKRANSSILPLRVSEANPDSYRRAVYAMVEAVVEGNAGKLTFSFLFLKNLFRIPSTAVHIVREIPVLTLRPPRLRWKCGSECQSAPCSLERRATRVATSSRQSEPFSRQLRVYGGSEQRTSSCPARAEQR